MSRSDYTDDCEYLNLWRAAVDRAIGGKRGQTLLRDLLAALDAMPVKRLIAGALIEDGEVCALGALAVARGMNPGKLPDEYDFDGLAKAFNVAPALAREIFYQNDECFAEQTPEERWQRMRKWVADLIRDEATA